MNNDWLQSASSFFEVLPLSVWTVLLTGVGALYALWKHDQRDKINREMQMRREIYLDCASAVAGASSHIAAYYKAEMPDAELNSFVKDFGARILKAQLIANVETIKKL